MKLSQLYVAATLLSAATLASAHDDAQLPIIEAIAHAPIGVMGDHRHNQGEFMFSYRYMQMNMTELQQGDTSITDDEAVMAGSHMVPQRMTMEMHMLGGMYGLNDCITLMVGLKYLSNSMTMKTFDGMAHSMNSSIMPSDDMHDAMMLPSAIGSNTVNTSGFGDIKLSALVGLSTGASYKFHANVALSLPTGSITESDEVLMPTGMTMQRRLGYMMQLGSGTYDVTGGLTYVYRQQDLSLGAQYLATVRLGRNDEGYSRGDQHQLNSWAAYQFAPWVSSSLRLAYRNVQAIDGRDDLIMADPKNSGGEGVDLGFGVNLAAFGQHRLAFEYVVPVYEQVNGIRLAMDDSFILGYQLSF